MTTFQTINMILPSREHTSEATTPTTPRAFQTAAPDTQQSQRVDASEPTTPTRLSFGSIDSQRPLPASPYEAQVSFQTPLQPVSQPRQITLKREESHRSVQSNESMEVDGEESEEEEDGSDAESDNGQTGRPAKKKKGQRFFCTDFPPCNLSFTRSEHLARHIRKHTGERPFQCHCTRRFSRLDNLRQHAQTVHVNEEIPGDSLAATGTRFQRQIRTDRVRPPGPRSRASTVGSQGGGHNRGHSRNLSASSVGSNASTISNNDVRRRPPSMMMPQDSSPRAKLSIDTRGHIVTPPRTFAYVNSPAGGPSTPASSTYSNDPSSPFGSTAGSPIAGGHRYSGSWNLHGHGRRLSVPSGANPFQPPQSQVYPPYFSPVTPATMSNNSSNSSLLTSPVSSVYSFSSRHDPQAAEADSRRRTWHPSTYSMYPRPATSGLSYYQTPDAPRPSFAPQAVTAVNNSQRLPGIDAIDHFVNRPRTPQRSGPWPVENESPQKTQLSRVPEQVPTNISDRRNHNSWDLSLHQGITKLDLASGTPPKDLGIWGQQTMAEMQNAASSTGFGHPPPPPQQLHQQHQQQQPHQTSHQFSRPIIHQESQKRPTEVDHYPSTKPESNRSRRNGWYNGPPVQVHQQQIQGRPHPAPTQRRSPEDSSSSDGIPTPSSTAGGMDPIILQNGGFGESHGSVGAHNPQQNFTFPSGPKPQLQTSNSAPTYTVPQDTTMSGLEALVAAATSEEKFGGSTAQTNTQ